MASTMEQLLPSSIPVFFLLLSLSALAATASSSHPHRRHLLQSSPPSPSPQNIEPPISDKAVLLPPSFKDGRLVIAVATTAILSFVTSSILFSIVHYLAIKKYRRKKTNDRRKVRKKEGTIVDESGIDVVYWQKLGGNAKRCKHCNSVLDARGGTLLDAPGGTSLSDNTKDDPKVQEQLPPPLPPPPPPPPPKAPPPPVTKKNSPPGPPMPPMPPRSNAPPPPLPGGGPSRFPAPPGVNPRTKLRPLHWDKLTALNTNHSMVWDKIDDGSFRFDDDLMETLFAYAPTNHQSNNSSGSDSASMPTQVCLLEPRKSQNFAIVICSLGIGRQAILNAIVEGQGLSHDTLEKLSKITPTKEEETKIINFAGDPSTLADAESFLYHILRKVPSPFARIDAMLFQFNYEMEILHLKQSLQTLELACRELRSRGLFLKLLEAILKAGNRMNAGTARGNAKAFNLSALCKLSDVKSTDGKTTLLYFVVEEVVRYEGKRLVVNHNQSLVHSGNSGNLVPKASRDQKEKEYMMLGLTVIGGLSSELANVKKAATIDSDALINSCLSIGEKIREIRKFMSGCANDEFVKEMKEFLEAASEEIRVVGEEQVRILELVKRTTEYYQPGSSKDTGRHPLHLFVIVRDFLVLFDRVCVDITRKIQKKPASTSIWSRVGSSKAKEEKQRRVVATFPNLPPSFMSENLRSSSSGSDSQDEF